MNTFYAMQRANGDWFAVADNGNLRMPVFLSAGEAMVARTREPGMECFKPALLDEPALEVLHKSEGDGLRFWMVTNPSLSLKRANRMDLTQLGAFKTQPESRGSKSRV